jgi:hypothetical protein
MWKKIRENRHNFVVLHRDIEDFTIRIAVLENEKNMARKKMVEYKDNELCMDAYKRVETAATYAIDTLKTTKEKMEKRLSTLL